MLVDHSFKNLIVATMMMPKPKLNLGVTLIIGSDRVPGTIVAMKRNADQITVQTDEVLLSPIGSELAAGQEVLEDGSTCQRNLNGVKRVFTRRGGGVWIEAGKHRDEGISLVVGERDHQVRT